MFTFRIMDCVGICVFFLVLVGCGVTEIGKETRDLVKHSNQTQEDILGGVQKTAELTEKMKKILEKTEDAIHLQTLSVAWQQIISLENKGCLNPPTRMMPFADAFAREASEDELIKVAQLLLQDSMNSTSAGEIRMISVVGMSAIAGFTSLEKTKGILRTHVDQKGKFQWTAYVFATVRFDFIRDYLFNPLVENSKFLTIGSLLEAVAQFNNLRHIAGLPYVNSLELIIPSLEIDTRVVPTSIKTLGRKAKRRFLEKMDPADLQNAEVKELLKTFDQPLIYW